MHAAVRRRWWWRWLGIDRPRWPPARPPGAVVSSTARRYRPTDRQSGRTDGGLCASAAAGGRLPPLTAPASVRPSIRRQIGSLAGRGSGVQTGRPAAHKQPGLPDSTVGRRPRLAAGQRQACFNGRPRRGTSALAAGRDLSPWVSQPTQDCNGCVCGKTHCISVMQLITLTL